MSAVKGQKTSRKYDGLSKRDTDPLGRSGPERGRSNPLWGELGVAIRSPEDEGEAGSRDQQSSPAPSTPGKFSDVAAGGGASPRLWLGEAGHGAPGAEPCVRARPGSPSQEITEATAG